LTSERKVDRKDTRRRFILGAATVAAAGLAAQAITIKPASAQGENPFLGEIAMVAFDFAPKGWALCNGQLLPISQYTALFSLLGTTYGGDGVTTFALPNLQGQVPMHVGANASGKVHALGESGGAETVTLTLAQMPTHEHALRASPSSATSESPKGNLLATETQNIYAVGPSPPSGPANGPLSGPPFVNMSSGAIGPTGGNASHTNLQPYLTINFIIALEGIFPSQG